MGSILGFVSGLVKTGFQVGMCFVTAIPLSIVWNSLVPVYFSKWIPVQFQYIPFWHVVGLLILFTFVGEIIQKLTPKIVSVSSKSEAENKNNKSMSND